MSASRKGDRIILGLMSGTSHDGVDAALVRFAETGPELLYHHFTPCPRKMQERISHAQEGAVGLTKLNSDLGEFFGRAAMSSIKALGMRPSSIDAIASHGQTIFHIPPVGKKKGSTLQIGSPAVIAQMTGIDVVSDFRSADMAAGGHGAPLVPFADNILFGQQAPCAVHNIGGISNVTILPGGRGKVSAFDTGPGNSLMDAAMVKLFERPYDRAGATAKRGKPDEVLLKKLLSIPYFKKRPPKSTGKELFGREMLRMIIKNKRRKPEDLLSTLTHFTALSIADAYRRFVLKNPKIKLAIFAGGGTKNRFLMDLIRKELDKIEIKLSDDFGVPSEAREAMSFAILANETLEGRPSNIPSATGASKQVILGSITKAG